MAVVYDTIGIQSITASLVESVETERKVEEVFASDSDSGFGAGEVFNPMFEFTVRGKGDTPVAAVLAGDGGIGNTIIPDLITGGVTLITGVRESESNSNFQDWEVTGVNAPGAS